MAALSFTVRAVPAMEGGRTRRALEDKLQVWERGSRYGLAMTSKTILRSAAISELSGPSGRVRLPIPVSTVTAPRASRR
jgi:hypothetical protein